MQLWSLPLESRFREELRAELLDKAKLCSGSRWVAEFVSCVYTKLSVVAPLI